MTLPVAITLDQLTEAQSGKATTVNNLLGAMSAAALWGVKSSVTTGLAFGVYGGNLNIAGVPTAIASQTVALTASTINYIYATSAGVVTKTTSAPAGWPGPLAASAIALYKLDVGASTVDTASANTVCYILGLNAAGATGSTGATGAPGTDLASTRTRLWTATGGSSTVVTSLGFDTITLTGTAATARTLASTSLRESIPYVGYPTSVSTAGASAQIHSPRNFGYLGNVAGRGGFTLSMRFCMENTLVASPANMRCYFGLMAPATIGNVEPDTLLNIIGVGSLAGDSNLRVFNNDGSGTATKTAFTTPANFPARATDNVYELVITTVANSGTVSLTLTDIGTGNTQSFTISSDIMANTVFTSWVAWVNNGSTAATASFGMMQVVAETRY